VPRGGLGFRPIDGRTPAHFGPFHAKHHSQFSLDPGDAVGVVIDGASLDVRVKCGRNSDELDVRRGPRGVSRA